MSLTKITCPSCGASAVKYVPLDAKIATCHRCHHKFDVWKEGIINDEEETSGVSSPQLIHDKYINQKLKKSGSSLVFIVLQVLAVICAWIYLLLTKTMSDGAGYVGLDNYIFAYTPFTIISIVFFIRNRF
jgi:hypothetical protein